MGSCLSSRRNGRRNGGGPAIGKNQPLKKYHPHWRSEVALTEGQLRSKRDEFWDTAPAFEGRKEIWDALKAAAVALESKDYALAQAIIDGANITLPHGTLLDCYDELGAHYQLPIYCLVPPGNIIKDSAPIELSSCKELDEIQPNDKSTVLKIRLSTARDLKLEVLNNDLIHTAKRRLQLQENIAVSTQRWFYSGEMLTDHMRLDQCKIDKGCVVQCIIMTPLSQSEDAAE